MSEEKQEKIYLIFISAFVLYGLYSMSVEEPTLENINNKLNLIIFVLLLRWYLVDRK